MRVLLYTHCFLTRSMTFVYNQLVEAERQVSMEVAATGREHEDLFPYPVNLAPERRGLGEHARALARRTRRWYPLRNVGVERGLERIGLDRFDLVHAHFGPSGLRIHRVLARHGLPLLVTFHGQDASRMLRLPGYVRGIRRMFEDPRVHGVTVSKAMGSVLEEHGLPATRLTPLYIGTDTRFFDPGVADLAPPGEATRILQVSNFMPKKGHRFAVEAFALARRREPQAMAGVELVLAGTGPTLKAVRRQVQELGIESVVSFPGPLDRAGVRREMARAAAFLHHSITDADGDREGIPTVLMEAMAMGLPVLSTRHSGIPELVRHGVDGLLVDERDVEGQATALAQVAGSPDLFGGSQTRQHVLESFDVRAQTRKLVGLYRELGRG